MSELGKKSAPTFDFSPLLLGTLHRVHREVCGHVDREVGSVQERACKCVTL